MFRAGRELGIRLSQKAGVVARQANVRHVACPGMVTVSGMAVRRPSSSTDTIRIARRKRHGVEKWNEHALGNRVNSTQYARPTDEPEPARVRRT